MANGEVIDLIPDADEQLQLLPPETFSLIQALHEAGAITLTSLTIEQPLTDDQADALLRWFGVLKRSSSWWIGDLLNQLETTNSESYSQLSEATGLAESTRLAFQSVCANVSVKIRKTNLGFSHHSRVSRLEPKEQKQWLDRASKQNWTYATLVEHMKAHRSEMRPQLPGAEDNGTGSVDQKLVVEVAQAILRDAQEHPEDPLHFIVPVEDIVRLRAALGQEE
jgi:hypothetical protein